MVTPSTSDEVRQPLGLGSIVGDAFSIYFRRFGLMFALSLFPAILALLITDVVPVPAMPQRAGDGAATATALLVGWITWLFAATLSNTLIVLAAFDTKIGRPGRLGVYIERALANIVTIILMLIAVTIVMASPIFVTGVFIYAFVGSDTLGSAGIPVIVVTFVAIGCVFYLWSAFSPLVPAIVIEGAGFGAMGRAWALTRFYRGRIVGVMLALLIAEALVDRLGRLIARLFAAVGGEWLSDLASLATNAVAGGILAVGLAMIYARLRAIKEGLDVKSLADVFS